MLGVILTNVSTESINVTLDILSRKALLLAIMMLVAIFAIALLLSHCKVNILLLQVPFRPISI